MTDKILVLTTAGSDEEAKKIARVLVERRLAACVNIISPITSMYRWQGNIEEAQEYLLLVKTAAAKFPEVRDAVTALHSYDVPECISVAIVDGSAAYLEWMSGSLKL